MRTLVLNAGYEPLSVVSFRRAIVLVLAGKATVLADDDVAVHGPSTTIPRPSVIILRRYVKLPRTRMMPLSRRSVLRRDGNRCAYCSRSATTIDHILPRSRGGTDCWENLVACCLKCNNRKGARTPQEMGWSLGVAPSAPSPGVWFIRGLERARPQWEEYLAYAHAA